MKISILDLKEQYMSIKKEIDEAMKRVIENQDFVLGEDVVGLERDVAVYCETRYGVGVASGTDALILALKALDIGKDDEVITTPFTFFATAEAISLVGARPVFVDIDPKTYNIDPALIKMSITKRTKAIIPVHIYGQCADMDPILDIANEAGLKVIEDNAQAIGAGYRGKRAGSMGHAGALSFFPSKNLGGFGDGGMVVTNDEKLATKIRLLRVHGSSVRYIHSVVGTNSRLDNLQAAILRVKLRYLDKWLEARRERAKYYDDNLKALPLEIPFVPESNIHTYYLYVLKVKTGLCDIMKYLADNAIETRTYYPVPLHLQVCYKELGYKEGDLPRSEDAAKKTFSIALYPELKKEQMDYIIGKIRDFYGK